MAFSMTGKLLKWGNSYGVRLAKADVEAAGFRVGDELHVQLGGHPARRDLSKMWTFAGPDAHGSRDHDRILNDALERKLGLKPARRKRD